MSKAEQITILEIEMNKIKKVIDVLAGDNTNPIIKADMIRVLREQFTGMENTLDAQHNHVEELKAELDKDRWIPVSERLPDIDEPKPFWVWSESMGMFESLRTTTDKWLFDDDTYCEDVTHWQPLPQPPTGADK